MFKKVVFVVAVLFSSLAFSGESKIAMIVNGTPITNHDIDSRLYFFQDLYKDYGTGDLKKLANRDAILHGLVNEILLIQEGAKLGIKTKDIEIDRAIKSSEESLNMQTASLFNILSRNNSYDKTYRQHIKSQLILEKIVDGKILPKISVSEKDVIFMMSIRYPEKVKASFKQISFLGEGGEATINKLRDKKISCANFNIKSLAQNVEYIDVESKISDLSLSIRNLIATSNPGESFNVPEKENDVILICNKEIIADLEEVNQLRNDIFHTLVNFEVKDYMKKLRARANLERRR